ncbi:MAG: hypothetical protein LBR81_01495 [Prevotellaceae bacterium]|jgi:hypothetical protein|nr:hypothetical protein [Prevotellaceae bacterium]
MEILINELSLTGQFGSIGDFIGRGLTPFLSVISNIDLSTNILYKKRNFWNCKLTATDTIHDILVGKRSKKLSRTNDEIRKSKSILTSLIDEPFWEDTQKHNTSDKYKFYGNDILNSSLAETCERDKIVISFVHSDFSANVLSVSKNGTEINVDNLFDNGHYFSVAKSRRIIISFSLTDNTRFTKTSLVNQGKSVYQEISTGYFWCLDNFHRNHYEVFDSIGKHLGEADLKGNLDSSKKDTTKKITV